MLENNCYLKDFLQYQNDQLHLFVFLLHQHQACPATKIHTKCKHVMKAIHTIQFCIDTYILRSIVSVINHGFINYTLWMY